MKLFMRFLPYFNRYFTSCVTVICFVTLFLANVSTYANQNVSGHGNVMISGDNNRVKSNTNIPSNTASEDLAKGNYKDVIFEDKTETDISKSDKKKLLIVTATNYETQVIQEEAKNVGLKICKEVINDQVVYNLGSLGGVDIMQMQPSMMGMLDPGSTPLMLMSVFRDLNPDYIIATGIAFGRESKGQKLGDILVSRQLVNYESRKESNENIYFRGDKVTSPLLGRINGAIRSWKGANIHQGVVLSGNTLVNSKEFLTHLSKREPEYVGGDMESYGVYAVASMMGAQWIMIKGISDWGDGTKNDNFHKIALENVGKFIFYAIKTGNF